MNSKRFGIVAALETTVGLGPFGAAGPATAASGGLLTGVNSGKCLDVQDGATNDFTPVDQHTCYGGPVQQWQLS
jgi:hypothetical protein